MKEDQQELQLMHNLREGNKEALSKLFMLYHGILLHYGLRVRADHSLTEECIQELFLYLVERGSNIGQVHSVRAYLYKSLRRRMLEKLEKLDRESQILTSANYRTDIVFLSEDIECDHNEIARLTLLKALNDLPWRQREAVYLRYYNSLTTREIAEIMGAANQTILNTLYQALKNLRKNSSLRNLIGLL